MTAIQSFFDWTDLTLNPAVYADRRRKAQKLLGDEIMLVPSRHGPDHDTFRQNDNFNYFTGLEVPEAILVLDGQNEPALYLPRQDGRFWNPGRPNDFPGRPLADDPALAEKTGLDIRPWEDFTAALAALNKSGRTILIPLPDRQPPADLKSSFVFKWNTEQGLAFHLLHNYPDLKLENGYEVMTRLRMVKGPEEVAAIEKALAITQASIRETAPLVAPGVDERSLIGHLEWGFRKRGAQRVAFDSIIKGGINAHWAWRILGAHYNRRNYTLQAGEVVIFDVGAELNYYVCDIGRTFPVTEHFSDAQADALVMVGKVVDAIIAAAKPGVMFRQLREIALNNLPENQHEYMQVDSYFGHNIGLSSGDPILLDQALQAGMVITVEPWYYNHDQEISVFIEQNVLITEDGTRILSADLPTDPDSLEKIRQGK